MLFILDQDDTIGCKFLNTVLWEQILCNTALKRCKDKMALWIMFNDEINRNITEIAFSVEDDNSGITHHIFFSLEKMPSSLAILFII